jgi:hypothetical protein
LFWREVWWQPAAGAVFAETDVEPSPPQAGVAPQGALLSTSSGGAVSSDPGSRTISISSGSLALTASTAASLNAAFGHQGAPEFSAGEAIGSFSVDGSGE